MIPAILKDLDRTKPLEDSQYEEVKKLKDSEKAQVMQGFKSENWTESERMRHYRAEHFPVVKYYSPGGGGTGALTPPISK